MGRPKKQKIQQTTEAPKVEDQSASTTVPFVTDSILQVKRLLDGNGGYIVPCGMCGTDIWIYEYDDNLVYLCGPCGDNIPD